MEVGDELGVLVGQIDDDEGAVDISEGVGKSLSLINGTIDDTAVFTPVGSELDHNGTLLEQNIKLAEIVSWDVRSGRCREQKDGSYDDDNEGGEAGNYTPSGGSDGSDGFEGEPNTEGDNNAEVEQIGVPIGGEEQ